MFARYAVTFARGEHRDFLRARADMLGLAVCIDREGLLFVAEDGTPNLPGEKCLVVGQLFSSSNERILHLDGEAFGAECTLGAWPNRRWGNFVLFDAACPSVYREPSGSVPVYHCFHSGQDVFVSDADFALRLGLLGASSPDLRFAVHWLQYPFLRTPRTGLQDVVEILPGVRRARNRFGEWHDDTLWRPADFIGRGQSITGAAEAAHALRSCALSTIGAQCRDESLILQLSGGLDSSIIAACLHAANADVEALNFATRSADGDERRFARDVAHRFHFALREVAESEAPAAEGVSAAMLRPSTNPLLLSYQAALEAAARESGRSVLVDGGGGDNLFCYVTSAAPAVDALLWKGVRQAIRTVEDVAARANCTWWQAAGAALHRLFRLNQGWKEDRSFLKRDVLLDHCDSHPWLVGLEHALPGKRDHVIALVEIQHFLDRGCSPSMGRLHPLVAQPLLETCLRIPSWMWLRGGRDRAIARDAFEHLLPQSVLRRRAKGSLESLLHRNFSGMRDQLRETLLGGELRRCGTLDTAAVETALAEPDTPGAEVQLRLTEMVALEEWLNDWRLGPGAARTCS